MTKKSPQLKYIGIITSVYSVRKMGSASLYRNSRKDSSVSETLLIPTIIRGNCLLAHISSSAS